MGSSDGSREEGMKILFNEVMMFLGTRDGRIWAGYDGEASIWDGVIGFLGWI